MVWVVVGREVAEAEDQLRKLLRGAASSVQYAAGAGQDAALLALEAARQRMRSACRALLLEDVVCAVEKEVDLALWKLAHYRFIERHRRRLRKLQNPGSNPSEFEVVTEALSKLLADSSNFYTVLLQEISHRYELILDGSVIYMKTEEHNLPHTRGYLSSSHPAYLVCHRCLVILGDLARYRKDAESSQSDWAFAANKYYKRAIRLWPASGMAHNQLAVVATYRNDDLEAAYRYSRAIHVPIPFATARDNLSVLYQRIRQYPDDPTPPSVSLVNKFLLLAASIGADVDPARYRELWDLFRDQLRHAHMGSEPLTDRVLYCMMTVIVFSVTDLLNQPGSNTTAIEQPLELLLCLAASLTSTAVASDNRVPFLPAISRFVGWAISPQVLAAPVLMTQLAAADALCTELAHLAQPLQLAEPPIWSLQWEEEELRYAFRSCSVVDDSLSDLELFALAVRELLQRLRPEEHPPDNKTHPTPTDVESHAPTTDQGCQNQHDDTSPDPTAAKTSQDGSDHVKGKTIMPSDAETSRKVTHDTSTSPKTPTAHNKRPADTLTESAPTPASEDRTSSATASKRVRCNTDSTHRASPPLSPASSSCCSLVLQKPFSSQGGWQVEGESLPIPWGSTPLATPEVLHPLSSSSVLDRTRDYAMALPLPQSANPFLVRPGP